MLIDVALPKTEGVQSSFREQGEHLIRLSETRNESPDSVTQQAAQAWLTIVQQVLQQLPKK